ncbi:hypothetical protein V2H45_01850 [Tumidithrix elongata RA019]|uniref:DUF2281 domain-containing protein n=1 Tax=Tumidithrix elongata BACA0141 TaxID=2716417 RepID=A0AAW9PYC0_9CYAN|nr:hypothetical protein [Tumidithrix elongata RA019]
MTIVEKAVSMLQQLPIEKQQEALSFIEFLAFKLGDRQIRQFPENSTAKKPEGSPRDLLKKWEGVIEGGVDDLSFNKQHMEGYGQS